ncbi:hypothetical protein M5K25_017957 [Dendrobium thyrsiflorum]|uniref:Uncharacterized protein n=1 Tax=Dendrobium thyrsiflorum TaxID=117978 RepID=A0ABD0UGV1_DENTH
MVGKARKSDSHEGNKEATRTISLPPTKPRSRTATMESKEPSRTASKEPKSGSNEGAEEATVRSLRLLRSNEVGQQRRSRRSDPCNLRLLRGGEAEQQQRSRRSDPCDLRLLRGDEAEQQRRSRRGDPCDLRLLRGDDEVGQHEGAAEARRARWRSANYLPTACLRRFEGVNERLSSFERRVASLGIEPRGVGPTGDRVCSSIGIPLREVAPSWSSHELWKESFITTVFALVLFGFG